MHKQLRFPGRLCTPRLPDEYRQEVETATNSYYVESHELSFSKYEDVVSHLKHLNRRFVHCTHSSLYTEESRNYLYVGFILQNVYPKIVIIDIFRKVKGIQNGSG